jgi:hypothetical protein
MNFLDIFNGLLIAMVVGLSYWIWHLVEEIRELTAVLENVKSTLLDEALANGSLKRRLAEISEIAAKE